jgi:hypothetical protein
MKLTGSAGRQDGPGGLRYPGEGVVDPTLKTGPFSC